MKEYLLKDVLSFVLPVYSNCAISRDVIIELTGEVYTGVVKEYKKVDKCFTIVHTYSINGKPIEEGYINATNGGRMNWQALLFNRDKNQIKAFRHSLSEGFIFTRSTIISSSFSAVQKPVP
ncbi:hypothetical protein [Mucilaginibacter polytrichastri]|uniref:hypothetical protein n=1 Tax=Mucilaginibacter polytrichastri TaxID=1302689 RepID=UPI00111517D3|nr:hypothetical protein [Mucilaginibacter polytrichastri]